MYSILTTLREYLNARGIKYFREIKTTQDNVMISCPYHKEGQESKASCGVSRKDGTVHCFTCGKVTSLENMISYVLGYNDNGEKGILWLDENILKLESNVRNVTLDIKRDHKSEKYITEQELDSYKYYHPYMFQRKLDKDLIEKFDVGYDKETDCLTFPVRDIKGNTLFIARRHTQIKMFNYPSGVEKPLYGLFEMDKNRKEIIICESILNCITCYKYGKQALALNGTGTNKQIEDLKKLPVRIVYLGLDNDDAGNNGAYKIYNALKDKFIVRKLVLPVGKDINDLEEQEFKNLFNNFHENLI